MSLLKRCLFTSSDNVPREATVERGRNNAAGFSGHDNLGKGGAGRHKGQSESAHFHICYSDCFCQQTSGHACLADSVDTCICLCPSEGGDRNGRNSINGSRCAGKVNIIGSLGQNLNNQSCIRNRTIRRWGIRQRKLVRKPEPKQKHRLKLGRRHDRPSPSIQFAQKLLQKLWQWPLHKHVPMQLPER